jgi:GNAT superfamily N-acetyltransferase
MSAILMKEFWRRSCAKVRRLNAMTMHIEAATEVDVPALSKLLAVLFAQEAEFTPNPEAQCSGLLRIITNRDVGIVLVAKEGETVLGMVILLYTISIALGGRVALLEDMVVGPKARGGGIGSHLLQRAVAVAEAAGCLRITLLTDQQNLSAQRFYTRHGFTPSSMVPMRLDLAVSQS